MGNWRDDKDEEIPLDGIGGVNILVKAEVHRSGMLPPQVLHWPPECAITPRLTGRFQGSTSPHTRSKTKQKRKASPRWPSELGTRYMVCLIMSSGTTTPMKSPGTHEAVKRGEFSCLRYAAAVSVPGAGTHNMVYESWRADYIRLSPGFPSSHDVLGNGRRV